MVDRLPWARPFRPSRLRWRLADAQTSGPDGFGLPPTTVTTDGGGWWTADFGDMPVQTPMEHRALRAFASAFRGGRIIDVPFVEQSPLGGIAGVGFSDGATFSDGAVFESGLMTAVLDAAIVGSREDELRIRVTSGPGLNPFGDMFSLYRGADKGSELHLIETAEQLEADLWRVEIGPMTRQAYPAGAEVNFNDPHCAMKIDDPEGRLWPEISRGWNARAGLRLVEAV
jgi:hypothetical protein